ncbi:MAG: ParB/RepB/Spo0J family partition protein [Eubacteriales bacterium]|nr:ParB/RepB/Spo0J family partition protein [Eubacteriales bacterium]
MASKNLGRGLSALFGDDTVTQAPPVREIKPRSGFHTIPLVKIEPNRSQPRRVFDEDALQELENSIRRHGVLAPITVRAVENGYYQIIAGERRWRAARRAGLESIPAMVIEADDQTMMELAMIENLQREDLNPIEEAEGFRSLIDDFGMTQDVVAERVGRSRSAVTNSLRLLSLSDDIRAMVSEGKLTAGHARAVLSIPEDEARLAAAQAIAEEGMSVRQAEAFCKKQKKSRNKPEKAEKEPFSVNYYEDIQKKLEASLGRRVHVSGKKNKGKIELEFYGNEDLERLAAALTSVNL